MAFKEEQRRPPESIKPAVAPEKPKPTSLVPPKSALPPFAVKESRLASLDAYRGAIMLLLASGAFGMKTVMDNLKAAGATAGERRYDVANFFYHQLEHVTWQGGVLWDLIQPAFMFMVGAALPYSYAKRAGRGDSYIGRFWHALVRSAALVLLGVFLSSIGKPETNWKFMNVLSQIGLGYMFVFLLVNRGVILQTIVAVAILGGTWYAFYQHPLPPDGFDYAKVGIVKPDDKEQCILQPPVFAHWTKNTNFAAEQDRIILNKLPRSQPYEYDEGGYTTLNFVPSIVTMLLGLMVGELLRGPRTSRDKLVRLLIAGAVCIALGLAASYTVCPIVKRIWTPSWALASGGAVIWLLALFYAVFDVLGLRRLALPLAVVGMNSFLVYMMSQTLKTWTGRQLHTFFDRPYARFADWANANTSFSFEPKLFGGIYGPIWQSVGVMVVFWLVCVWLYRQKLFVRL